MTHVRTHPSLKETTSLRLLEGKSIVKVYGHRPIDLASAAQEDEEPQAEREGYHQVP